MHKLKTEIKNILQKDTQFAEVLQKFCRIKTLTINALDTFLQIMQNFLRYIKKTG